MNGMEWEVVVVVVVLVVVLVAVAAMVVQCGVGVQWTGLCAVLLPLSLPSTALSLLSTPTLVHDPLPTPLPRSGVTRDRVAVVWVS